MSKLDLTAFDAAMKEFYVDDTIENLVFKDHPTLAILPKMEEFYGDALPIPAIYGNPQGASSTFSKALANQTSGKYAKFLLTRNKGYSIALIDGEALKASQSKKGAFLEAGVVEVDGALLQASSKISREIFRTGGGAIGRVANSSFTTTALTLDNPNDVVNFEVGMVIQTDTVDGGGTVNTGTLTISAIDYDTGAITTTQNLSTGISGIAQHDYIFVEGDYDLAMKGFQGWMPYDGTDAAVRSTALGTSFFGLTRSSNPQRLGGVTFDGSAMPIEEAIPALGVRINKYGGNPDTMILHHAKWEELEKSLGSKVVYGQMYAQGGKGDPIPELGFKSIKLACANSMVDIIADKDCPSQYGFMIEKNLWKLYSLGKAPQILMDDNLRMLRSASDDAYEVRIGYYAQVGCRGVGRNGIVYLGS